MRYLKEIKGAFKYISREKYKYFITLFGVGFSYSGMTISVALIPQVLIDACVSRDFGSVGGKLLMYLGIFFLSAAAAVFSQYTYRRCVLRAVSGLRKKIMEKKAKLPLAWFESSHSGDYVAKMVYDVNRIEELYRTKFKDFFNPMIALETVLVPMFLLNGTLTILLLFVSFLCLLVNATFSGKIKKAGRLAAEANDAVTERTSDIVSGLLTIRQYQLSGILADRFREVNEAYAGKVYNRIKFTSCLEAMNKGFDILCSIVFLVAGSVMVREGKTTYGTLIALMSLESNLIWAALQAGKKYPELFDSIASVERIETFLSCEEEKICVSAKPELSDTMGFVEFQHVSFQYEENREILHDFSLKLEKDVTAVITGPSGCGKSTLFKLLMGFYNVTEGTILIDGKCIDEYELGKLRDMIAYIPQKPFLFNDTILENIRIGRPGASDDEVQAAAKAANAHEFIMNLPGGYSYVAGEQGRKLSFGQKQRIIIARAFLKDAPIILFDEATSGLDNESERLIRQAAGRLTRNKTALIITHRGADAWGAGQRVEMPF